MCFSVFYILNLELEHAPPQERPKRAAYPPCPCKGKMVPNWDDLFLYTNGRCYGQWSSGLKNYSYAQSLCTIDAGSGNAARSATFDSGTDYLAITAAMTKIPLSVASFWATWIGLSNQKWDDPFTPSCPPPINVAQFQSETNITIPASGYVAVGVGWATWNSLSPSAKLYPHVCEIGKKLYFAISKKTAFMIRYNDILTNRL